MKKHMTILLLGGSGMLGSAIQRNRIENYTLLAPNHKDLDITKKRQISNYIEKYKPNYILYAAAVSSIDQAEKNPANAYLLNAEIPAYIASRKIPMCYVSTDAVFDGVITKKPFNENHIPNPISVYGKSKLLGENSVLEVSDENLVVRLNTLYSTSHKKNDIVKVLGESLKKHQPTSGISDQFATPIYVDTAAQAIWKLISSNAHGVYHIASITCCSNLEFVNMIAKEFSFDTDVIYTITMKEFIQKKTTHRSNFTCLDVSKFTNAFGKDILKTVKEDLSIYKKDLK